MSASKVRNILRDVISELPGKGDQTITTWWLQMLCIGECLDLFGPDDATLFEGTDGIIRIEKGLSQLGDKVRRGDRDGEWIISRAVPPA